MISSEIRHLTESIPKQSVVVLHVGLRGIYENSRGYTYDALTLLDEIRKQLEPRAIYVPTFTYTFTKSKVFDVRGSLAEVGRFSEEIRSNSELGVKRNLDPVFSVIETEGDALRYNELITNAFGANTIWNSLDNESHYILNVNLPVSIVATQLHYLEYINNVPYRYLKTFEGCIFDYDGEKHHVNYDYFVRDLSKDTKWNRDKIADLARLNGALVETSMIRSFDWQALKRLLINEMTRDLSYLIR